MRFNLYFVALCLSPIVLFIKFSPITVAIALICFIVYFTRLTFLRQDDAEFYTEEIKKLNISLEKLIKVGKEHIQRTVSLEKQLFRQNKTIAQFEKKIKNISHSSFQNNSRKITNENVAVKKPSFSPETASKFIPIVKPPTFKRI
jgi:septal ring factor EnvC (AmiA/AmiB activator)